MSKFTDIFNWLKNCPYLSPELWAISAEIADRQNILFLNDTSNLYNNADIKYVDGKARVTMHPVADYTETYTVNAYRAFINNADEFNIEAFDNTQLACDWIIEQQNSGNLFSINGNPVYAVELLTPSPISRGTDADNSLIGYYISIRLHMKNPAERADWVA